MRRVGPKIEEQSDSESSIEDDINGDQEFNIGSEEGEDESQS